MTDKGKGRRLHDRQAREVAVKIEITNCSPTLEREPEPCMFEIEDSDPHCAICGQQCSHSMRQWHPGPVIKVSGWFETQETYELDVDMRREAKLLYRKVQLFPDIPIVVTSCEWINDETYRYSFYGQKYVGVAKMKQGRAL